MSAVMAERIRLIIDTEERLRRAVRIAAARRGISPSDMVNRLIEQNLPDEVREADEAIAEDNGESAGPTKRRSK